MKRLFKKILLLVSIISVLFIPSCFGGKKLVYREYNVRLVYGDGREDKIITVGTGEVAGVEDPTREGFEFEGWCTDSGLTNYYDFNSAITSDVTLYAKWDFDYKHLLSRVSSEVSPASVMIYSNGGALGTTKQGSGVIYKEEGYKCYVLTNNHVVKKDNGAPASAVYVYDVYGNQYEAEILKSDPAYDLAVLSFLRKGTQELLELDIENKIPDKKEQLITVSNPKGKINTVELANMELYSVAEHNKSEYRLSNVKFEVLWLLGNADNGSSGGVVVDADMNIIGIIYGSVENKDSGDKCIVAVPAPNILEFLGEEFAE